MKRPATAVFFLMLSATLYAQKNDADPVSKEKHIEEIVFRGNVPKNTETSLISLQKKSTEVIERVGAVQLNRQGVSNAAVAVTKATGTQKQEGSGQIFIRGLGDRNNATTLNGLPIPSNDPIYKNLNLSLIKTEMMDHISLDKVYSPKMWGDMAGATIDIASKIPGGKPYFNVSIGTSANTNVLKEPNFYLQDGPGPFGFTPIKKPSDATLMSDGYAFRTLWSDRQIFWPLTSSLGLDFGRTFNTGNEGKLSVFGLTSFENDYGYRQGITRSVDNVGIATRDLYGTQHSYETNTTALLHSSYKPNRNHHFKLISNYIRTTTQELENYNGYIRDTNENIAEETALLRRANYKTNDLFINQISGEHTVSSPLKIYWNAGYNYLNSQRPDRMQNISIHNRTTNTDYFGASNPGANHRYFDQLIEKDLVADLHTEYAFNDKLKLTLGYNGRLKKSDFNAIQFNLRVNVAPGNYFLDPTNYGSFFNGNNYSAGFFDIVTFRGDIKWNPETALIPQYYQSEVFNNAGYANIDYQFGERISAQVGFRYDYLDQNIAFSTSVKEGEVQKNYAKFLPAFNLKYSLNDFHNLRFSASKTYTTPLLLEVAPYEYEEIDELSFGNPALYPADNYNADLKWEWFPKKGEIVSVTAFGKYIQNPISRVTVNSSSNAVSFVNIGDKGQVFGVEMEFRKDLYTFGDARFYTFLNSTYLNTSQELSREKVSAETTTTYSNTISIDPSKSKDRMQGASDFLANINIGFEQKWGSKNTLDLVLSYAHISDNIYAIGYATKGNLVDKAINTLDAVARISLNSGIGLSVSAKNLLNPNFIRIQDNQNGEVQVRNYKKGRDIGLGISYRF